MHPSRRQRRSIELALTPALVLVLAACGGSRDAVAPPLESDALPPHLYASTRAAALLSPQRSGADFGDAMRYHFIDVGQGDATLLEFPCGAVLIDAGGEQNPSFDSDKALITYLDAFFERRPDLGRTLDLFVVTHPHIDHMRSVVSVLERYTVRAVIDDGKTEAEHANDPGPEQQARLHEWLAAHPEVAHQDILASQILGQDGLTGPLIDPIGACEASRVDPRITVLWGAVTEELESYGHDPNNHSLVLRVDYGRSSALFTGDLELVGISRLFSKYKDNPAIFDVDIYQVGHHGSKNATIHYQMAAMSPKLAVISMGPYDRVHDWTARKYGHPNLVALEHLAHPKTGVTGWREAPIEAWVGLKGAWKDERKEVFERRTISKAIYGTGWEGTIVVTAAASGDLAVDTER